jgi:hypothetical protein
MANQIEVFAPLEKLLEEIGHHSESPESEVILLDRLRGVEDALAGRGIAMAFSDGFVVLNHGERKSRTRL